MSIFDLSDLERLVEAKVGSGIPITTPSIALWCRISDKFLLSTLEKQHGHKNSTWYHFLIFWT